MAKTSKADVLIATVPMQAYTEYTTVKSDTLLAISIYKHVLSSKAIYIFWHSLDCLKYMPTACMRS